MHKGQTDCETAKDSLEGIERIDIEKTPKDF